jgi:prepilin-type processing-associated H-X9-DG protein
LPNLPALKDLWQDPLPKLIRDWVGELMRSDPALNKKVRVWFSLKTLLVWTSILAVAMAVAAPITKPGNAGENMAAFLIASAVLAGLELCIWYRQWTAISLIVAFVLLWGMLMPSLSTPQFSVRRSQCQNNLKMLILAVHNFEAASKCFPQTAGTNGNGSAQYPYSWRIAILPYIEQQALYDQYRFDEPWDSAHNSELASLMPKEFRCPSHAKKPVDYSTSYLALTGAGTLFPEDRPGKIRIDARIGLSNMIALIECPEKRVHWMKPDDISLDEAIALYSPNARTPPASNHKGGCNSAWGDGSVTFLSFDPGGLMTVLQAMNAAAGQQSADENGNQ